MSDRSRIEEIATEVARESGPEFYWQLNSVRKMGEAVGRRAVREFADKLSKNSGTDGLGYHASMKATLRTFLGEDAS